jgi:malate dehydrogenase (quinone)
MSKLDQHSEPIIDILLVGAGVMSSTLGMLIQALDPELKVVMVEKLNEIAGESSDGWNNAGTGHAGYCELNYTPEDAKGVVSIDRALKINQSYEVSMQFWSHLSEQKILDPKRFIQKTPHLSFVWGKNNVEFLRKRHALLSQHHLFQEMTYSDDPSTLREWIPLMMAGRDSSEQMAATLSPFGTDVDFGELTRQMVNHLDKKDNFQLHLHHRVRSLKQDSRGLWHVQLKDLNSNRSRTVKAKFVFLGAGGGALSLLQKAGIPEAKGYGGFPVSGLWLVCNNESVIEQHKTKVYGRASIGAPPMSVPHLDTRIINGQRHLLFGPYAGFTTKFLKQGSFFDLIRSVKMNNLKSMSYAGIRHLDLTRYLIKEVMQTQDKRFSLLKAYYPTARKNDWKLLKAGQRVQIIKRCRKKGGRLEFGTEIVSSKDGSIAALLGASPGASTSVEAMLDVLARCFSDRIGSSEWKMKLREMIPSYGRSLIEDAELLKIVRENSRVSLGLNLVD